MQVVSAQLVRGGSLCQGELQARRKSRIFVTKLWQMTGEPSQLNPSVGTGCVSAAQVVLGVVGGLAFHHGCAVGNTDRHLLSTRSH
jgi:hypothetical protein